MARHRCMSPWLIRPALDGEAVACRAMLPEAFPPAGPAPDLFVALGHAGGLLGAAAMAWFPRGFPVLAWVDPAARRQGIGRALLRAAADAAAGETMALLAWSSVEEGCAAAEFLQAAGFKATRRLLGFETDGVRFAALITTLRSRVQAAGRVPADAPVIPLSSASPAAIIRLVMPEFGAMLHDVAWRLQPGISGGYDQALSFVVVQGSEALGCMLVRREHDVLEIDLNLVGPAHRRGWVNLLLLEAVACRGREAGVTRFRFHCEAHVRDTLNLGRRTGATDLPPQLLLALPLLPASTDVEAKDVSDTAPHAALQGS